MAYSQRRRYLLGSEAHGLMNYPFRTAALDWLRGGDAACFRDTMETIREHYPRPAFYSALNILGTHDTPRILTLLGAEHVPDTKDARAACGWVKCCCTVSPAPLPCTTVMRPEWRALRTP